MAIQLILVKTEGTGSAWTSDITGGSQTGTLDVSNEDGFPRGFTINPDGTKLYLCGVGNKQVFQYGMSVPFDLDTASYDSVASTAVTNLTDVSFKPDGTKMYLLDGQNNVVNQYSLSPAWDITSISNDNVPLDILTPTGESNADGIYFKPDGTRMYIVGAITDAVHQFDLSVAWDINTASYDTGYTVAGTTAATDVHFSDDGSTMYVLSFAPDAVLEFTLGTPWDIGGTVTSTGNSHTVPSSRPFGLDFSSTGTKVYTLDVGGKEVLEHTF